MKKVYVAGAMSADNILQMLENISVGVKNGALLLEKGFAPFVPHFDIAFKLQQGTNYNVPMEYYYQYTMEWLKASDCVLVCEGWENSKGTIAEINTAKELNIPVYFDIDKLVEHESYDNTSVSYYNPPIPKKEVKSRKSVLDFLKTCFNLSSNTKSPELQKVYDKIDKIDKCDNGVIIINSSEGLTESEYLQVLQNEYFSKGE